jgi:hypothetical protein
VRRTPSLTNDSAREILPAELPGTPTTAGPTVGGLYSDAVDT